MTAPHEDHDIKPVEVDRLIHEPARLHIMAVLQVVQSADFTFLIAQTGLSWGNLSSHIAKLEAAGYVEVEKGFVKKKPRTMLHLTQAGRAAFSAYRKNMQTIFEDLPD